jgi:hypothetical protein
VRRRWRQGARNLRWIGMEAGHGEGIERAGIGCCSSAQIVGKPGLQDLFSPSEMQATLLEGALQSRTAYRVQLAQQLAVLRNLRIVKTSSNEEACRTRER